MDDGEPAFPTDALEDIMYLSRSSNRVRILDALTDAAATRQELQAQTGTSRTTLDRIVNELEDRGWAERTTDGDYVATPVGKRLMEQFEPYLESVEAIRRLGPAVEWLPDDESGVDLRHFSDAEVRHPAGGDPVETVEFMVELVGDASEFRALTHLVPPDSLLQAIRDRVVSGQLRVEAVSSEPDTNFPSDRTSRRRWWRDILEAGSGLYLCDGPIPCNLWVIGETVLIKRSRPGDIDDSYGTPIVSDDAAVRSWAHDLIDRYQAEATRIDESVLSPPAASGDDS
jgi:predicted transcriptional regulator